MVARERWKWADFCDWLVDRPTGQIVLNADQLERDRRAMAGEFCDRELEERVTPAIVAAAAPDPKG